MSWRDLPLQTLLPPSTHVLHLQNPQDHPAAPVKVSHCSKRRISRDASKQTSPPGCRPHTVLTAHHPKPLHSVLGTPDPSSAHSSLPSNFQNFSLSFFLSFFGCVGGMRKFPDLGWNSSRRSDDARPLTSRPPGNSSSISYSNYYWVFPPVPASSAVSPPFTVLWLESTSITDLLASSSMIFCIHHLLRAAFRQDHRLLLPAEVVKRNPAPPPSLSSHSLKI